MKKMTLSDHLTNKTGNATYVAPTPADKEKAKHQEYKNLELISKGNGLEIVKVRKYKVVDPLSDKFYWEMVVALEDYDSKLNKQVYLSSININNKETPRFYAHLNTEITRLSSQRRE